MYKKAKAQERKKNSLSMCSSLVLALLTCMLKKKASETQCEMGTRIHTEYKVHFNVPLQHCLPKCILPVL